MAEAENVLQTVRTALQDIVAPEVRELKSRMSTLESRMGSLEAGNKVQFEAVRAQADANYRSILAAIGQLKAENELASFKEYADLRERVVALEAKLQEPRAH